MSSYAVTNSNSVFHPTLLASFPYNPAHKKTQGYKTSLFPMIRID